jgi:hypothetical protein
MASSRKSLTRAGSRLDLTFKGEAWDLLGKIAKEGVSSGAVIGRR